MTDQKHEEMATAEGMPEAPPLVDNDHVAPGAEQFGDRSQVPPQSPTAAEVAIQSLHLRLHALEEAFLGYLSHDQHNHPAVKTWTTRMRDKFNTAKQAIRDELTRLAISGTQSTEGNDALQDTTQKDPHHRS